MPWQGASGDVLGRLNAKSAKEYEELSRRIEEIVKSLKQKDPKSLQTLMSCKQAGGDWVCRGPLLLC